MSHRQAYRLQIYAENTKGPRTFYKLKARYEGLNVSDLKRLKALEDENQRLKQMDADISLEHQFLKNVIEKNSQSWEAAIN